MKRSNLHMPEDEIWFMALKLIKGLIALHSKRIVHRDIKCANVFLCQDGSVKLGDLNVSKIAKNGLM